MPHLFRFIVMCLMVILVPIGCQTQGDTTKNHEGNANRPQQINQRLDDQIDRRNGPMNRTNDPNGQIDRGANDPFQGQTNQHTHPNGRMNRANEQRNGTQAGRPQAQKTADRLVKLATSVNGVQQATAVVMGNYTLVGIDVDPTIDRNRVGTIKYSVAQALKDDPQGKNALVSADTDIMHRLRKINQQMAKGNPIAGLTDELADIAARIAPQPSRGTK